MLAVTAPCFRLCLALSSYDPSCTERQHGLQQLCPAPWTHQLHSISLHITSHHFTSLHITSYHFISLHITLYHSTSLHCDCHPLPSIAIHCHPLLHGQHHWSALVQWSFHWLKICHGDLISLETPRATAAKRRMPIGTLWHSRHWLREDHTTRQEIAGHACQIWHWPCWSRKQPGPRQLISTDIYII